MLINDMQCIDSSLPLSTGDTFQDPNGCLKPQIIPKQKYTLFSPIRYSKRLTIKDGTIIIIYCNNNYVNMDLLY